MSEYLAIKNWEKYQTARKNCTWVKDYVEKDFDPDVSKLTVFQRGVLDMCCRLRGRQGRNLRNDPQWIVSAVSIMPQERRNAMSAIGQLIAKGFLIPTDQQLNSEQSTRLDKKRVDKEEEKPSARQASGEQPQTPVDSRYGPFVEALDKYWKHKNSIAFTLGSAGGRNLKAFLAEHPRFTLAEFQQCLNHRARSDMVHSQAVHRWITRVEEFIDGPLDSFWKPKGVNGNVAGLDKANAREQRQLEQLRRVEAAFSGRNDIPIQPALPGGNGAIGAGGLAGNAKPLLDSGSAGGHESALNRSAKAGSAG